MIIKNRMHQRINRVDCEVTILWMNDDQADLMETWLVENMIGKFEFCEFDGKPKFRVILTNEDDKVLFRMKWEGVQ